MLPTHIDAAHDWLLTRLAHPLAERPGDVPHRQPNLTRPAAVLIPLVWRPESPGIVLTRRESGLRHHAGQISFPGGKLEPDDPAHGRRRCARRTKKSAWRRNRCKWWVNCPSM